MEIPYTVTKISKGAFSGCDDLKVQMLQTDKAPLNEWIENLTVEDGNDHLIDVIQSKRPAIGWGKFWLPNA